MTTLIDAAKQALEAIDSFETQDYFREKEYDELSTILRTAIQEAGQMEPIGEVKPDNNGYPWKRITYLSELRLHELPMGAKLYTQPPAAKEWQGLTEEEVQCFMEARWSDGVNFTHFIRAIEAKLKEKNT